MCLPHKGYLSVGDLLCTCCTLCARFNAMAEHPSPSWRQHWDAWALGSPGLSRLFASPQKGRKASLGGHEWLARRASDIFLRRVTVGNWLGPSALCHTLESVVNHVQPAGLQCRVVASSGGGAPVMCTTRCGSCLFLCSLVVHPSQLGTAIALLRSWRQGQVVTSCCLSDTCWNGASSCFSAARTVS